MTSSNKARKPPPKLPVPIEKLLGYTSRMFASGVERTWRRQTYFSEKLAGGEHITYDEKEIDRVAPIGEANLIGSKVLIQDDGWDTNLDYHFPVLDLDFEARLIPSSTPGHYHLYLDRAVKGSKYWPLLKALAEADLIEWGYWKASEARGQSFVRIPTHDEIYMQLLESTDGRETNES